jgi:hypothetical protein
MDLPMLTSTALRGIELSAHSAAPSGSRVGAYKLFRRKLVQTVRMLAHAHAQLGDLAASSAITRRWLELEPIEEAGIKIKGADQLTGLAEYRNGGLMLDSGLIEARNSKDMIMPHHPESDLIIEWRALTVYFLDQIGTLVQKNLNKSPAEFPLAKVLEGGTWWAGRKIALEKRVGGVPPLNIISDGTVF